MTLAKYFDRLRNESGLSLREIGQKARPKLNPTTLWKICQGRPVKADTLGVAMRALGYTERDQTYLEAFALWSTGKAKNLPHEAVGKSLAALRVKQGGGDGGHNGLRSIRRTLGTGDTIRIRVGIGRPPGRQDPADYVLKAFAAGQRDELALLIDRADDAIECVIEDGVAVAQNRFNSD